MTPERWAALERVVDQALELEAGERFAFLEQACSGDSDFRTDVEELLRAAESGESFLDQRVLSYASPLLARFAERALPPAGARLGSYEIIRELGRGGMATVFLARDSKHDRDVALKVMHGDIAVGLGTERFLKEIRISAQLDHPHILTLIDSGETGGWLWYVMPFVRGESLRNKLIREQRLSVEEAVRIAMQVASALEYAHGRGIIHRDIKPENILLHEGEAVVADYGIAVAVEEAGTRGGFPLGTPAYMSPEQARGQDLDARTDVYALAAVLYEMLIGEPPHTGRTAHDVIASMLAEFPPRIRTVRADVPEAIDAAIAKALAKAPDERFGGTTKFAAALEAGQRSRIPGVAVAVGGALGLGVILWLGVGALGRPGSTFVMRDRTQVTSTGDATMPAISADGTQLAYIVQRCSNDGCRYLLQVRDIRSGATRTVVDAATALYSIHWSPDRRHLLFVGTIATRYGSYIVSTGDGGAGPRFLGVPGGGYFPGAFFPGGDSLLLTGQVWVWVATLEGDHRDSIWMDRAPGDLLSGAWPLHSGQWVLVRTRGSHGGSDWRIVDRRGRTRDSLRTPTEQRASQSRFARVTKDGLWVQLQSALVHVPIDARRGKFAGPLDTVPVGLKQSYDVTADGGIIVFDDGAQEIDLWVLDLADALHGRFPAKPHVSSTSFIAGVLSPDGDQVLLRRPGAEGAGERDVFSVVPVTVGPEVTHTSSGAPIRFIFGWMPDGAAFWHSERTDSGMQFVTVDARTGRRVNAFSIRESDLIDADPLAGGGWVWLAPSRILRVQWPGEPVARGLPKPRDDERLTGVVAAADGLTLATFGWNQTGDSILVHAISLTDWRVTHWASLFGEGVAGVMWLGDGSLMIAVQETAGSATIYRVRGPGRVERVGTIPRPVASVMVSRDGRRAIIRTRDFRGDIWLVRIDRRSH